MYFAHSLEPNLSFYAFSFIIFLWTNARFSSFIRTLSIYRTVHLRRISFRRAESRSDCFLISRRLFRVKISPVNIALIMSYMPQGRHADIQFRWKKNPSYKLSVISARGIFLRGRAVIRVINYPSRGQWISRKNDSDRSFNLQSFAFIFHRLWQIPDIPWNMYFFKRAIWLNF